MQKSRYRDLNLKELSNYKLNFKLDESIGKEC